MPPPRRLSVALVTPGDNFFIEKVIAALGLERPIVMSSADYDLKIPTDFDVIVFDRYSPKKLPENGNFVYFGGLPPNTGLKQSVRRRGRATGSAGRQRARLEA